MNVLREKLARGETALGTHIMLNGCSTTEIIASLGFDYLWIDTEHTSTSLEQVEMHLLAARSKGVASLVRVPSNDPIRLKPVLEMGPDAVLAPMVNSCEEAKRFAEACLYPPKGIRGFGPRHASFYGMIPLDEYLKTVEYDTMRLIQIEHIDAVRDLDRILTVEGIDGYIIGPMDLSGSMGLLTQTDHPELNKVIDEICAKVKKAGKILGTASSNFPRWKARGVDWFTGMGDWNALAAGFRAHKAECDQA